MGKSIKVNIQKCTINILTGLFDSEGSSDGLS
jgi:hypothetical protein